MGHPGPPDAHVAPPRQSAGRRAKKKPLTLRAALLDLWDEETAPFRQRRSAQRARRLGLSQLACLGRHTLTGLLCACGRQDRDWSAEYRLFSRAVWQPRALFAPIVRGVLADLPPGTPFVAAMDDTHLKKTGTRIPGVAYRRDPLSPAFHPNFIRAQRFLQVSALRPETPPGGPARALPIAYEHVPAVPKPKAKATPAEQQTYRDQRRRQNLSVAGVQALTRLRTDLDEQHAAADRQLIVSVDGSYTNRTVLRALPERTTLIGRTRKEAKLFAPAPPAATPTAGPPRRYGPRLPTPEALRQDDTQPWQEVRAWACGREHTFRLKTLAPVWWAKAGPARPLRLVVIAPVGYRLRQGSKWLYRQPAYLLCTDPNLPLAELLQDYLWRWDIEVNHRDEKQLIGVGQAQLRAPRAVDRQPALAVASYSLLLLAAARVYGPGTPRGPLPLPKWQTKRPDQRRSTQELLRQLRSEVWNDALSRLLPDYDGFVTGAPAPTKAPEPPLPAACALLYSAAG